MSLAFYTIISIMWLFLAVANILAPVSMVAYLVFMGLWFGCFVSAIVMLIIVNKKELK